MKKVLLSVLACILFFSVQAQEKLSNLYLHLSYDKEYNVTALFKALKRHSAQSKSLVEFQHKAFLGDGIDGKVLADITIVCTYDEIVETDYKHDYTLSRLMEDVTVEKVKPTNSPLPVKLMYDYFKSLGSRYNGEGEVFFDKENMTFYLEMLDKKTLKIVSTTIDLKQEDINSQDAKDLGVSLVQKEERKDLSDAQKFFYDQGKMYFQYNVDKEEETGLHHSLWMRAQEYTKNDGTKKFTFFGGYWIQKIKKGTIKGMKGDYRFSVDVNTVTFADENEEMVIVTGPVVDYEPFMNGAMKNADADPTYLQFSDDLKANTKWYVTEDALKFTGETGIVYEFKRVEE
jgi:hypothetical protein